MNKKDVILKELSKYDFDLSKINSLTEIRVKNGIYLFRFSYWDDNYVIKYFEKEEFRREIYYYKLLNELNVPTIKLYYYNESSIILEDINVSIQHRLGTKEDLSNPKVALGLIKWYKIFHKQSSLYLDKHPELLNQLYNEYDLITKEVIQDIVHKSNSNGYAYWSEFIKEFDKIKAIIRKYSTCFTYNDFYYTNFIVSKDEEEVIMYDYNFLGKGFKYSDIRNVSVSLEGDAKEIFLKHYTEYNPIEKDIDEVFSPLFSLYVAYKGENFPSWAKEELEKLHNRQMEKNIIQLLQSLSSNSNQVY
ncbi:hypothetical protein KHQ81_06420 [Mycoplasmatota bacterium]|nr:hypothetical protein KHQ81_06420 [Mycoplasmatota bacterium]